MNNLNEFARVSCGFAAIKDLKTKAHEDRYLYSPWTLTAIYIKLYCKMGVVVGMNVYYIVHAKLPIRFATL